jgi:hypothetical protein
MCPNCGTQNPEGNRFCKNCGAPLAGAAPTQAGPANTQPGGPAGQGPQYAPGAPGQPPPGAPWGQAPVSPGQPPQWPPTGVPNPYYYPMGYGPAPAHRLHGLVIAGLVVALSVLMTLGALVFLRNTGHALPGPVLPTVTAVPLATSTSLPSDTATPPPTAIPADTATAVPTTAPADTAISMPTLAATTAPIDTATAAPFDTATPQAADSPTEIPVVEASSTPNVPEATATPGRLHIPAPTAVPTEGKTSCKATSQGKLFKTNTFCVTLVKNFSVLEKGTSYVTLKDEVSTGVWGIVYIQAGTLSTPTSVTKWLQEEIAGYQKSYPDVKECGNASQVAVDGQTGTLMAICYTITPQSGSAFPAMSELWAATAKGGSNIYSFAINTATDLPQVITDTQKLLETLHWTF